MKAQLWHLALWERTSLVKSNVKTALSFKLEYPIKEYIFGTQRPGGKVNDYH
jgi:hypothetical protein